MAIQIKDLTKIYGSQKAIDNILFSVGDNEIVGFLGPNGAGKSTTMKIITCFLRPTAGTVEVNNYNILDNPLEIRRQIGYLPEHNPLYLDMYVPEFLKFIGKLYGVSGKNLKDKTTEIIEKTGLGNEAHKKIGMLSKGYRQRVGLAQALIHDPPVLILDEPTSGLDPNQVIEIRNLIHSLGKTKTVLFSSHILSEVEAIANRVVIINKGKIIADSPIAELSKLGKQEAHLSIEFEKAGFNFGTIEKLAGFIRLEQKSDREYLLVSELKIDLRKNIYEESVKQNISILSLKQVETSLEDIFRQITE